MRSLFTALFFVFLSYGCSDNSSNNASDAAPDNDLQARITRIESNLQPEFQDPDEPVTYSIEERMRELGIPGLSVVVVANGKIDWAKGYGLADVSENRPVDTDTLFLAASVSKPISALRALQLVDLGLVSLDHNINDYLTSWQLPDNQWTVNEKVTVRRLLNHTAGLPSGNYPPYLNANDIPTIPEILDGEGPEPALRVYQEPGQSWQYANGGYAILGLLITDIGNLDFPAIMQEYVLNPLGMTESTFENPLPPIYHANAATGYWPNGEEVAGKYPIVTLEAAGGLWTTPSQLALYAIELQKMAQGGTDGILQYSTVEEMLTPGLNHQGLGPVIGDYTYHHDGLYDGFAAHVNAWKEQQYALVIMLNSMRTEIVREIQIAVAAEYDLPGFPLTYFIDIPEEQLARYVGTYVSPLLSQPIEIEITDGTLVAIGEFSPDPAVLVPTSDTLFRDRNANFVPWEFTIEDNLVTGIFINNAFEVTRSNP